MKKIISCILSIVLMIAIVIQPNVSQAKGNTTEGETSVGAVQVSSEVKKTASGKKVKTVNITMYLYNGKEIAVPKKLAKARWVVSDKDMVMVTKGKDKKSIALDTKGKTGKCTIKAKLNGKIRYKINLTVKRRIANRRYKGNKVKAVLLNFSNRTWIITYRMYNGSNKYKAYGPTRYLQKYVDGKWQYVPLQRGGIVTGNMFRVEAHKSIVGYCRLSDYYDTSKLTPGTYRLYVHYMTKKKSDSYVKFKIK
ncbi:MAG: hypothetical protein J6L77_12440 [Coprococcus sp.]|nr:hypothetical protein [Coprococcus sp.]